MGLSGGSRDAGKWVGSGCILEVAAEAVGGREASRVTTRFLVWVVGSMELTFTKMGKNRVGRENQEFCWDCGAC